MAATKMYRTDRKELTSTINSLRAMTNLVTGGSLNRQRFETCRTRVLQLKLSPSIKMQATRFLEAASHYFKYDEAGALKFELNRLIQLLRMQLERR